MRVLRGALAGLFVALASPALAQITCATPQKLMLDVELLLGRAGSEVRWKQFLAREVTPRFPDGLTVYETTGQWRDPASKAITREKSRVLRVIVPIDVSVSDTVDAIAQAYKKQFLQKSVGIVTRPVCAAF